jgi:DHA2 family multidrug resistance protein
MSSTIMEIIDSSVVNVSLPHIAGNLSASISDATWVITSYIVANAIILPLTGWLSNFFGRRNLLMVVITGFTVSSALCGAAPTLPVLVLLRVMQGLTGGGLQPLSQAVLLEEFPPEEHQQAMSIWGLGVVIAPILAPTLGGYLTDYLSWRWVFWINIPVGMLSFFLIAKFIHDPPHIQRGVLRIDKWGIGMLALGMGSLQLMFDKGQDEDWFDSRLINVLLVTAVVMLVLFVIRQLKVKDPLVQLSLLKDKNFASGVFVGMVMSFVLYGSLILIPLFMQTVLGWTAVTTGIWTSPRGLGALFGMLFIKRAKWLRNMDGRWIIVGGFGSTALIFFTYAKMSANSGMLDLVVPQFFQGVAVSLAFVFLTTLTMAYVPKERMPYATSLYSTLRNIGQSMGISFVATFLVRRRQFHQARLSDHVYASNPLVQQALAGSRHYFEMQGSDAYTATMQGLGAMYRTLLAQADILSYLDAFKLLGVLFLLVLPVAFIMRRPPAPRGKFGIVKR